MDNTDTTLLKGVAAKLTKLIADHSAFEFEGLFWLKSTRILIADHLGVNERTIRRTLDDNKSVFRYLTLSNKEDGKHVLIRVGAGNCESDHVAYLRKTWVHELVYFNAGLEKRLQFKLDTLHNLAFESQKQREAYAIRLKKHIERAQAGAVNLDKLKAGEKISLTVLPKQMGLLRGLVQKFGEDAQGVFASLLKPDNWEKFMAYLKSESLETKFYHWPNIGIILKNPHLALEAYLDTLQSDGKIGLTETKRLMNKIHALQPKEVE